MNIIKGIIIRWSVKQIKKNVHGGLNYAQLGFYGVEDIVKLENGEDAYIL